MHSNSQVAHMAQSQPNDGQVTPLKNLESNGIYYGPDSD